MHTFFDDFDDVTAAVNRLRSGMLVGMPTETVYGLAADAFNPHAMASIYATKGRPSFNPLIIHIASIEEAEKLVEFNPMAMSLAHAFWPGPLTLVLPRTKTCKVDSLASAGLPTLAIRIPNHPLALSLIKALNHPIAAPSANLFNQLSPTTKNMVQKDFPDLFVLDGGSSVIGLESTIIGFEKEHTTKDITPILLRPGGISKEDIEKTMGVSLSQPTHHLIQAPGMIKKHYAPKKPLRINATEKKEGEVFLGFGTPSIHISETLNLSLKGDLTEAASNLFQMLHLLEISDGIGIAVAPIPHIGLGVAINDRLYRGTQ